MTTTTNGSELAELAEQRRAMLPFEGRLHEDVDAEADVETALPILIDRERRRRDAALRSAAVIIKSDRTGDVDKGLEGQTATRYRSKLDSAAVHDTRVRRFEQIGAEKRASVQVREPGPYGPGSGASYYLDQFHAALGPSDPRHAGATDRLQRHAIGISRDVRADNRTGQRALRQAMTMARPDGGNTVPEARAVSTGTAGAFVTPQYLTDDAALYRTYAASFYEQTTKVEDAGWGMQMLIPAFALHGHDESFSCQESPDAVRTCLTNLFTTHPALRIPRDGPPAGQGNSESSGRSRRHRARREPPGPGPSGRGHVHRHRGDGTRHRG